jgi:hypothetical protein
MRNAILFIILPLIVACGSDRSKETIKFRDSAKDAAKIGILHKLTDDGRSIYPIFAPGDSIVYYQRMLLNDVADTFAYFPDQIIKPYGVNVRSGELYTLDGKLDYPSSGEIEVEGLPKRNNESIVWAIRSLDSSMLAFETIPTSGGELTHIIYLVRGDSAQRLTFGDVSCFIDRFSNTGRYLTAVYNTGPAWIIIYDLKENVWYRINRSDEEGQVDDYLTTFSSDDSMMLFIRTTKEYTWNKDYFGDIWLLRFNNSNK